MKTIILSDIMSNRESIIPFGLNIGKFNETEVDVVHLIDARTDQGVSGSVADSKSIILGTKMSHNEIIEKRKNQARQALDRLLSREGSRLNYPLKINVIIEPVYLEEGLKAIEKNNPEALFITSSEPENSAIENSSELFSLLRRLNSLFLLVTPGTDFQEIKDAILLLDVKSNTFDRIHEIIKWLKPFGTRIEACTVTTPGNYVESELESEAWQKVVNEYIQDPGITFKATALEGTDRVKTLVSYIEKNHPGLVILPGTANSAINKKATGNRLAEQIHRKISNPVLIY